MVKKYLILSLFLTSCSGYYLKDRSNPFFIYGISSISVPMFVNKTALPNVSSIMTKDFLTYLRRYSKLKVTAGENTKADAILIGIVSSNRKLKHVLKNSDHIFTAGGLQESIGNRNPFYLPSKTQLSLSLRVVLIKDPSNSEIASLHLNESRFIANPKIIFDKNIILEGVFTRSNKKNINYDDGGVVNFTNDKHSLQKSVSSLSKEALKVFNHEIVNVF